MRHPCIKLEVHEASLCEIMVDHSDRMGGEPPGLQSIELSSMKIQYCTSVSV